MENNKSPKGFSKLFESFYFKLALSGIIMFVCALLYSPVSGVCRTIPFFAVGGALAVILSLPVGMTAAFCALMTMCTYLVSGRSVGEAGVYTLVAELLLFAGVYAAKLVKIYKRNKNATVRKKCVVLVTSSVIVAIVASILMCGNVVSFVINNSKNTQYIEKYYKENVEKRYTCYEAFDGEYKTYVSFRDGEAVYGNDDDCYISRTGKTVYDGVREYHEDVMLSYANGELAKIVSKATSGFNVTASDIKFENGEILSSDSDVKEYLDRVAYVVSIDSIINENEKHKFVPICYDAVTALNESGFKFDEIVLCAGRADEVLFSLVITPETTSSDVEKMIGDFNEKQIRKHGVTEEDILGYWSNK